MKKYRIMALMVLLVLVACLVKAEIDARPTVLHTGKHTFREKTEIRDDVTLVKDLTVETDLAVEGDTTAVDITSSGDVSSTQTADGNSVRMMARASISGITDGSIGTNSLGITIPDNAVIVGGYIDVTSHLISSNENRTIGFEILSSDDIYAAVSNTFLTAGINPIVPVWTAASAIKMTNSYDINIVIADYDLTNGAATIVLWYDLLAR